MWLEIVMFSLQENVLFCVVSVVIWVGGNKKEAEGSERKQYEGGEDSLGRKRWRRRCRGRRRGRMFLGR